MIVTCPYCHRSISTADGGDAPSFCMYCGHKLTTVDPHAVTRTIPVMPVASSHAEGVNIAPESAPSTIGGYKLLRLLGAGGMGAVYEAEAPGSSARVAVKLLSSKLASNPTSVERFKQEGRLASQLSHPRCVFVIAADADAGRPYIVMELMPGETLKDVVDKRGPLPAVDAITYMLDVIQGLSEAHRVGMIHRDMKPSNCFLTADGRVKVGDFGLSKSLIGSRDQHLTHSGAFLGTVLFAPPEQIRGEPLDYGADVYSVCATLYYLLCGQAPYQHESITAALAKAISEDAPPVRTRRPDVSRGLEAIVMKGLERDRERRWQSLDDLRDALIAQLPSRQHPARPRSLIGAYILDRIFLSFFVVPVELFRMWATDAAEQPIDLFELRPVSVVMLLLYFSVGEGIFGATPGKLLLGLRVSRVGQTGPPGVVRALVRATVFSGLLLSILVLPEKLVEWLNPVVGGTVGALISLLSIITLLTQFRRQWGFRGLHDRISGCHVTQKPLPSRRLRLPVKHPSPLSQLLPAPGEPLPATVGGYSVKGRLSVEPGGEQVWIGEDRALDRSVLLWLKPTITDSASPHEAARPTRLRKLGRGTLTWSGTNFEWVAFAAPLGGPIAEAITPANPLLWPDARHLLEQLVEEFRAAEVDGTMPAKLGLDRVWAEPNGRLQLLECSVSVDKFPVAASPMHLLREVASLALEGRPRSYPGPVHAPLPAHSIPILDRLFRNEGYRSLADFQRDLADTHAHNPEVTPALRAAQLGIQAGVLAIPFTLLFLFAGGIAPYLVQVEKTRAEQAEAALIAIDDPAKIAKLSAHPELKDILRPERLETIRERLGNLKQTMQSSAEQRRPLLFTPQRVLLEWVEKLDPEEENRRNGYPVQVREAIRWAGAPAGTPRAKSASPWMWDATPILATMLLVPVGLLLGSAILRGGLSMLVAGITVVRGDGRLASQTQSFLRAALTWIPFAAFLFGAAWIQAAVPERIYLAAVLWFAGLVLLSVYVVIALRYPNRPPQDRIAGTYLVPT